MATKCVRAVGFLRDQGIRQFLDVGTGLPTSPNTYEVAQQGQPDARVVYVDNDPIVFRHAEARMSDNKHIGVVASDLRDVDEVLAKAGYLGRWEITHVASDKAYRFAIETGSRSGPHAPGSAWRTWRGCMATMNAPCRCRPRSSGTRSARATARC